MFATGQLTTLLLLGFFLNLLDCSIGWLGHDFLLFGQDQFNVAWRRHERIDTTVSTVSASADLGSALNDDVVNNEMIDIQVLKLSISFGVSANGKLGPILVGKQLTSTSG